ncbi:MAG: CDP-diacylglycerol--glycerol-3-phosphate 3-phosphatidyltransferase [Firmicutes bacterium]|nr:CDP-diacylglycerol--glycerol-3-phosphate 3-phosphatidyltransferase [Bacillota bacterium]
MNLPTTLTIVRIVLVPVFMALVLVKIPYGAYFAALVFILAAITDGLDGYIARSRNQVTKLGQLLDPIADKLLISGALVSLVQMNLVSAWVAMIIIGREFAVSGLRMVAVTEGIVIAASKLGKIKTITQIVAIVAILLQLPGALFLLWLAALITIVSAVDYFARAGKFLNLDSSK